MGKAALDKLRRERAESRNEELQKLKEVQEIDEMLRETPEAAVIPEKVAQRMGKRMLPFVGIPLIGTYGIICRILVHGNISRYGIPTRISSNNIYRLIGCWTCGTFFCCAICGLFVFVC